MNWGRIRIFSNLVQVTLAVACVIAFFIAGIDEETTQGLLLLLVAVVFADYLIIPGRSPFGKKAG